MYEDDDEQDAKIQAYDKGSDEGYQKGIRAAGGYKAGHKAGYAAGYAAAINNARSGGGAPGRPAKYPWALIEPGHAMIVPETDLHKVYQAGKKWSHRQGQGHRFRVQPHPGGTLIKRTDNWNQGLDGDIIVDQNPNHDWM